MKNLFKAMQKVVDKYMEHYKSDFQRDKEIMLEEKTKEFYWYVRKSGTDILNADKLQFFGSEEHSTADYFFGSTDLLIFHIKVEGKSKGELMGSITPVEKTEFKKLINNTKAIAGANVKVSFKDNTIVEGLIYGHSSKSILERVLIDNKKEIEQLEKYTILNYVA